MRDKLIPVFCGDGGGIRCVTGLVLADEISNRLQAPMASLFAHGLIAGVSGSGINTGLMAHPAGISPEEGIEFYIDEGSKIFQRHILEPPPLFEPKFANNYLAEALQKHLGTATLNQALCPVFIPVWDLSAQAPWWYTERDFSPIWIACRATAAVPAYIPTWGPLCDGGVFGSNCTLWALHRARELYGRDAKFLIISCGTSWGSDVIDSVGLHVAGDLKWMLPIIKQLADANPIVTELMTPGLVGPEDIYFRWKMPTPTPPGPSPNFDDGSKDNVDALIKFQRDVIASRPDQMKAICDAVAACQ